MLWRTEQTLCRSDVILCWMVKVSFSDQVKFEEMPEIGEAAIQAKSGENVSNRKNRKHKGPEFLSIQETATKSVVAGTK